MTAPGRGHPIDPFLAVWASRGGRDGLDLRLRVYHALSAEGAWSIARLRVTLRSLLAFTPDEKRRFDLCFGEFFPPAEAPPWLRARLDALDRDLALAELATLVTPPAPTPPPPPPPSGPTPRSWRQTLTRLGPALAACALVTFVALAVRQLVQGPPPTRRPRPEAGVVIAPEAGAPPPVADGGAPPEEVETKVEDDPAVIARVSPPDDRLVAVRAAMAILLVLALLTAGDVGARAWRHRPLRLEEPPPLGPLSDATVGERQVDLRSPTPLEPPLDGPALDRIALRTGFALDPAQPELDLRATVYRTARGGGILDPAWRPGRRPPVLRVCHPSALDPVATEVLKALSAGLRARGLAVVECVDAPDETPADLSLVVIDASRWRLPHQDAWRREAHVAYLEARDPGRWDPAVLRLPFGVFTLDAEGIAEALDAARAERLPPRADAVREGDSLQRLGEAFALAAACSFAETFDLATLDALRRRISPDVGFLALQRVLALDGVTGGPSQWTMSPGLRAWFSERVPRGSPLREAALDAQAERLRALRAPPGSRAAVVLAMHGLWVAWQRGFDDEAALDRWMTEAERLLGDAAVREVFDAQRRRQPPPALPAVEDALRRMRMARLGMGEGPPERGLARVTWGLLATAGVSSLALGALTTHKLSRSQGWSVTVRAGPWSDAVGPDSAVLINAGCGGASVTTGIDRDGVPTCRKVEPPRTSAAAIRLGDARGLVGLFVRGAATAGPRAADCEDGAVLVGVDGDYRYTEGHFAEGRVTSLRIRCARPGPPGRDGVVAWRPLAARATLFEVAPQGPSRRAPWRLDCAPGGFVQAIRFSVERAVSVRCASLQVTPGR